MRRTRGVLAAIALLVPLLSGLAACSTGETPAAPQPGTAQAAQPAQSGQPQRSSHQDWPTGPYRVVENWPKPLRYEAFAQGMDVGIVRRRVPRSPDRIWIAMRGELPLPENAAPWTPYAALNPTRGNATGNGDGISATCEPTEKRGWERRYEHSIFVVDGEGNLVDEWPHLDPLFAKLPCGRGPHQIKISPYDHGEARVDHRRPAPRDLHASPTTASWCSQHGTSSACAAADRTPSIARPTSRGCLTAPTSSAMATAGSASPSSPRTGKFIMDWGQAPKDPKNPGPNEFNTVHSIAISADRRLFVVDRGHAADAGVRRERQVPRHVDRCARRTGRPARAR